MSVVLLVCSNAQTQKKFGEIIKRINKPLSERYANDQVEAHLQVKTELEQLELVVIWGAVPADKQTQVGDVPAVESVSLALWIRQNGYTGQLIGVRDDDSEEAYKAINTMRRGICDYVLAADEVGGGRQGRVEQFMRVIFRCSDRDYRDKEVVQSEQS